MKRIFLLAVMASMMLFGCSEEPGTATPGTSGDGGGQETFLAPTDPMNRNAVLEDFTGVRCGYCPDGHDIANKLIADNPGRVSVLGIHVGQYADARPGWANFTNSYNAAILAQAAVGGYPAGTMNRQNFIGKGQKGGLAMDRHHWKPTAEQVMTDPSPVNIGAKATLDSKTFELTVKVDLYYTGDESANENRINVALAQNKVHADHSDYSLPSPYVNEDYEINHIVRDFLTAQWGALVPAENTTEGSKYSETYKYDVPTDYNGATIPPGGGEVVPEDLEVTVFVSQGKKDIITGITIPVTVE